MTDACVVLGYLDPDYFLGGEMALDRDAAHRVVEDDVAEPLGLSSEEAAESVLRLATERMVRTIEEITVDQGIDPRSAALVGGGGAAGLNIVAIARELGCSPVIVPQVSSALSAAGALMSDLGADFGETLMTSTADFDRDGVNAVLRRLSERANEFIEGPGAGSLESEIELVGEARYPHQVWELELPLRGGSFDSDQAIEHLRSDFDELHQEVFAISDPGSAVEVVAWQARARCRLRDAAATLPISAVSGNGGGPRTRRAYFRGDGSGDVPVLRFEEMQAGERVEGPALIELPLSTVVLDPGAAAELRESGSILIDPGRKEV